MHFWQKHTLHVHVVLGEYAMIHFHGNLRSIEYWFRCLDVDGDGVLSLYELQLFYEEVLQRLQELSIECLSVENTVCQVLDMISPRRKSEWGRGREKGGEM